MLQLVHSQKEPERKLLDISGGASILDHNGMHVKCEYSFDRARVTEAQSDAFHKALAKFNQEIQQIWIREV